MKKTDGFLFIISFLPALLLFYLKIRNIAFYFYKNGAPEQKSAFCALIN